MDFAAVGLPGPVGPHSGGHTDALGIRFHAKGDGWVELAMPYRAELVGDIGSGILASGPIVALMDVATSLAIWSRRGRFVPHATLDLRVDYLRPARPGHDVVGHGECYALKRAISFIRGYAHDGDPDDPIAHVAGTYMNLGE
jgi:uncharacterized protein (TIGR00369 family)